MSGLANVDKAIKIIVVDDFSTMRRIVKDILKQLGFRNIDEAVDGKQALEMMAITEYQFIVSDWNMPNMMGIDLLRAVRSDERLKKIPFLMVTAETKKEDILEAAKAGVSNYIGKPFTPDVFEKKLEQIFAKKA